MAGKTIFVITTGDYSDYHIVALFSTKEKAEEYIAWADKSARDFTGEIEEWELDGTNDNVRDAFKNRLQTWCIELHGMTGGFKSASKLGWPDYPGAEGSRNYNGDFYTTCWARDKKHAIKIANERRIAYKMSEYEMKVFNERNA